MLNSSHSSLATFPVRVLSEISIGPMGGPGGWNGLKRDLEKGFGGLRICFTLSKDTVSRANRYCGTSPVQDVVRRSFGNTLSSSLTGGEVKESRRIKQSAVETPVVL